MYALIPIVLSAYWFDLPGGLADRGRRDPAVRRRRARLPPPDLAGGMLWLATLNRALVFFGVGSWSRCSSGGNARWPPACAPRQDELAELESLRPVLTPAEVPARPHLQSRRRSPPPRASSPATSSSWSTARPGSTTVVVGDVVGHGLEAARCAAFVRAALATYARFTGDPVQLLQLANAALGEHGGDGAQFVTAICLNIAPPPAHVRWAAAGHDVPWELDTARPCPAAGWARRSASARRPRSRGRHRHARPGAGILLFTDGLVEGRGARRARPAPWSCSARTAPGGSCGSTGARRPPQCSTRWSPRSPTSPAARSPTTCAWSPSGPSPSALTAVAPRLTHNVPPAVTPRKPAGAAMGHGHDRALDRVVPGGPRRRRRDDAGAGRRRRAGVRRRAAAPGRRGQRLPRPLPAPAGAAGRRHGHRGTAAVPGPRLALRRRGPLRGHPLPGADGHPAARGRTWPTPWAVEERHGWVWLAPDGRRPPPAPAVPAPVPSGSPSPPHQPDRCSTTSTPRSSTPGTRWPCPASSARGAGCRSACSAGTGCCAARRRGGRGPAGVRRPRAPRRDLAGPGRAGRRRPGRARRPPTAASSAGWLPPLRSPARRARSPTPSSTPRTCAFVHAQSGPPRRESRRRRPRGRAASQRAGAVLRQSAGPGGRARRPPLRQRRRTTYTFRAPFQLRLRQEFLDPGRRRRVYLLQPEDLDSSRLYACLLLSAGPGPRPSRRGGRQWPAHRILEEDIRSLAAPASRAAARPAERGARAGRRAGVALRQALSDFALAGQRQPPPDRSVGVESAPQAGQVVGGSSSATRPHAGQTRRSKQAGSPPSSSGAAGGSVTAPSSREPGRVRQLPDGPDAEQHGGHDGEDPPPPGPPRVTEGGRDRDPACAERHGDQRPHLVDRGHPCEGLTGDVLLERRLGRSRRPRARAGRNAPPPAPAGGRRGRAGRAGGAQDREHVPDPEQVRNVTRYMTTELTRIPAAFALSTSPQAAAPIVSSAMTGPSTPQTPAWRKLIARAHRPRPHPGQRAEDLPALAQVAQHRGARGPDGAGSRSRPRQAAAIR